MIGMMTTNYVVCDDDVSCVYDVVDIDRHLSMLKMIQWVNVIDFDYYRVEIVCDDNDDDDDNDGDNVYETFSFFSFYVLLPLMMN